MNLVTCILAIILVTMTNIIDKFNYNCKEQINAIVIVVTKSTQSISYSNLRIYYTSTR